VVPQTTSGKKKQRRKNTQQHRQRKKREQHTTWGLPVTPLIEVKILYTNLLKNLF